MIDTKNILEYCCILEEITIHKKNIKILKAADVDFINLAIWHKDTSKETTYIEMPDTAKPFIDLLKNEIKELEKKKNSFLIYKKGEKNE